MTTSSTSPAPTPEHRPALNRRVRGRLRPAAREAGSLVVHVAVALVVLVALDVTLTLTLGLQPDLTVDAVAYARGWVLWLTVIGAVLLWSALPRRSAR